MWEVPLYLIVAPLLTLVVTLISTIKYEKYFISPIVLFILLNIPTFIIPNMYNIGWIAIFGWAVFYTVISAIISLIVWFFKKKNLRCEPA